MSMKRKWWELPFPDFPGESYPAGDEDWVESSPLEDEEDDEEVVDVVVCPDCGNCLVLVLEGSDNTDFGEELIMSGYCVRCKTSIGVYGFRPMSQCGMAS